jgi:hypothetical protein
MKSEKEIKEKLNELKIGMSRNLHGHRDVIPRRIQLHFREIKLLEWVLE